MRISFVSDTWTPDVNGVALTVSSMARGLHARGHDVEIIRPDNGSADPLDGLRVRRLPLPCYPELCFGLPAPGALARHWAGQPPDVVYLATEGLLGHAAKRQARRCGAGVVSGFHTRFDRYMRHYRMPWMQAPARSWLRRFHCGCDVTLVPTRELAGELADMGIQRVGLLHRSVDTRQFHPRHRDRALRAQWGCSDEDLVVVSVGRLAREKNLDLLLCAFRSLQSRIPRARLVMVGDGPQRAELESANPDVIFAGTRRGDDLAAHYASADLFLFPSLSETFGNVVLEAMASGLAVVAFNTGAAREHIQSGIHGALVEPTRDTFCTVAFQVATDRELCRHLGHAAHARMASLNPGQVIADCESILFRFAGRPQPELQHVARIVPGDA